MNQGLRLLAAALSMLSLLAATPIRAEEKPGPIVQLNINATLRSQDFRATASKLTQLVEKHRGLVTNLSLDTSSPNGSAYFKLPPSETAAFMEDLPQLGDLQNLNQSSSDNTRSYEDTRRRLETFEKMARMNTQRMFHDLGLSPEEELSARAELETFIRDRINSYRSSLDQYRDYQRWVQVNLSFQQAPAAEAPSANQQTQTQAQHAPPPAKQESTTTMLLPVYLLVAICLFGLMAVSRKLKK